MSDTDLLTRERQTYIRECLDTDGRVIAADLAAKLNISVDTIRRDLREMANAGLCERVYGGALPPAPHEADFQGRRNLMPERKIALAKAALDLLESGMSIFIDAGTTNLAIAQTLPKELAATVITNAPAIAAVLLDHPACQVVMIGGQVDKQIGAALGARAMQEVGLFNADLAIIGTCGFDVEKGLSAHTLEEREIKHAMAKQSRKVAAVLANDKLGTAAKCQFLESRDCNILVLEHDAPEHTQHEIEAQGIEAILAGKPINQDRK